MIQEDKNLLFPILCAMLPYGVIVAYRSQESKGDIKLTCGNIGYVAELGNGRWKECKPYLRPLSSMTVEELHEIQEMIGEDIEFRNDFIEIINSDINTLSYLELCAIFDWLNAHHFDYRGLIKKGLAIDCTGMHIYD